MDEHILIVAYDNHLRRTLENQLKKMSYITHSVESGNTMMQFLKLHHADLILLDRKITTKSGVDESEKQGIRNEQIIQTMLDGFILADQQGRILKVNQAYCKMVGYSEAELLQMNIRQMEGKRSAVEIEQWIERLIARGTDQFKTQHIHKSGYTIDLNISISIMKNDGVQLIAAFVHDISEQIKDEAKINQRTKELAAINAIGRQVSRTLSVEEVIAAGIKGMLETVHPDAAFYFHREGDRLILKKFEPLIAKVRMGEVPEHRVGECMCGLAVKHQKAMYSRNIFKDLRCTWNECKKAGSRSFAALPVFSGGEVIGVLGLASDKERDFEERAVFLETLANTIATSLKNAQLYEEIQYHAAQLEDAVRERTAEIQERYDEVERLNSAMEAMTEDLKLAVKKAQSADELKSAFLASMSHELRTPLNSIIGFISIILQGLSGPLNAEQTKQLAMAKSSAMHLLELINDVLDISKIEAGQIIITKEKFPMREAVQKVVTGLIPLAEKKRLHLKYHIAGNLGTLVNDRRRIEQVLVNLINNAIKFTSAGEVRVDCRSENNRIITAVSDTGIGISRKNMTKIFNEFEQLESGLDRKHEGTGLGLSISKKLTKLLGGELTVDSTVGKGSTFTLYLPLK